MKLSNIYLRFPFFTILIFFCAVFNLCAQYESVNLESQAQAYCEKGWNLLKEGRMEEATLNYKKAIELDPGNAEAYGDLGIIFEVKGQMGKAEEMYLKAIKAAPDYLNSYSNVALLYEKQGDYAEAIFYWKKRLSLSEPDDPYAEVARKRLEELTRLHPQARLPLEIEDVMPAKKIAEARPTDNTGVIAQLNQQKELNQQLKTRVEALQNLSRMDNLREKDVTRLKQERFTLEAELAKQKEFNNDLEKKTQIIEKGNKELQEKIIILGDNAKEAEKLRKDSDEMNEIIKSLNDKLASIVQESSATVKEKEELSLKADTYKKSKEELEKEFMAEIKELKKSNTQLETKGKEFYIKALGAVEVKNNLKILNKVVERMNQRQVKLKVENEELKKKNLSLENSLKNEKARLCEELGTAYTKAKLYKLAIQAYEESLVFSPKNAAAHYNLGLLYKHYLDNSKKAKFHLKKYLELNSKASNRKEVEYLIGMLGENKF